MVKNMQKIQSKLKQNNSGMAIVLVIVAIAMTSILVSVLMTISLLNFKMKTTEKQAKDNFYSAEVVLDQIYAGLKQEVSDSMAIAYAEVMPNYGTNSSAKLESDYRIRFASNLKNRLCPLDSYRDDCYFIGFSYDDVDGSLKTSSYNATDKIFEKGLAKYLDKNLAAAVLNGSLAIRVENKDVPADKDLNFGAMYVGANEIILKNLVVEYLDDKGYYSKIKTDIAIAFPNISVDSVGNLPEIFEFCLIGEGGLSLNSANNVTIRQSAFFGDDVKLNIGSNLTVDKSEKFIVKNDVVVDNTSTFTTKGNTTLWAHGINLLGMDISALPVGDLRVGAALDGYTYLADDLTLNGNYVKAVLAGNYVGYGNPNVLDSLSKNDGQKVATNSSAIVLNCKNSELNLTGLGELSLFGTSYIMGENGGAVDSVMIGNSVSAKYDQIAYLAPAECLGVVYDSTGSQSLIGKNPIPATGANSIYYQWKKGYEEMYNAAGDAGSGHYYALDVNQTVGVLGKKLSDYGLTEDSYKTLFKNTPNGELVCYVFLDFKSSAKAAEYFRDYYNGSNSKINEFTQKYNNHIAFSPQLAMNNAGNFLYPYNVSKTSDEVLELGIINDNLSSDYEDYQIRLSNTFSALCHKLTTNYLSLSVNERDNTVFVNLMNVDSNGKFFTVKDGTQTPITGKYLIPYAAEHNIYAIVSNEDIKIRADGNVDGVAGATSANTKLIITSGNVTVARDYAGMIIAGGKIIVEPGCSLIGSASETDRENVKMDIERLMKTTLDADHGGNTLVATFFRNGNGYVTAPGSIDSDPYVNIDSVILFRNWTKE